MPEVEDWDSFDEPRKDPQPFQTRTFSRGSRGGGGRYDNRDQSRDDRGSDGGQWQRDGGSRDSGDRNRGGGRGSGNRSDGGRDFGNRNDGDRGYGSRNDGGRNYNDRNDGGRGFGNRNDGGRGFGNSNDGDRGYGSRNDGGRNYSDRNDGGRGFGNRNDGDRGFGNSNDRDRGFDNRNDGGRGYRSRNDGGRGFDDRSDGGDRFGGARNGITLEVGTSSVGRIIGRGGSKIRDLESESGARIKVNKPNEDDYGTTRVELSGSYEAQEKAKRLIEDLIEDKPPPSAPVMEDKPFVPIDWDALNKEAEEYRRVKWSKAPPMKKKFYNEHPDVAAMSPKYVEDLRAGKNGIVVKNVFKEEFIPNPVETFDQAFADYPEILEEIRKLGFKEPSPIQCQAWPVLLGGRDLIGIAQTGTGKTLAFLLPALIHIDGQPVPREERGGPNVLIIAPTRELAQQIEEEVKKYSYRGIKSVCVYGGGSRKDQVDVVASGVEIVIATPGRLNDLVEAGILEVSSVTYLVLDEADRMLDMGFEPQIRKVLLDIRPDRQSVMTSATWPACVRELAARYMENPVQVFVGSLDLAAVHSVTQTIVIISHEEKKDYLYDFINNLTEEDKVMVFVGRKTMADHISSDLGYQGIVCQCIHGDRAQCDREQALKDLKTGEVRILIATDVASRGIDITDITKVLNYDFPRNIEEYVHRCGRTGRAGRSGEAISLFTREDWRFAGELIEILNEAGQLVPEELAEMKDRFEAMKARQAEEGGGGRRRYDDEDDPFGGVGGGGMRDGRRGGRRGGGGGGRRGGGGRW